MINAYNQLYDIGSATRADKILNGQAVYHNNTIYWFYHILYNKKYYTCVKQSADGQNWDDLEASKDGVHSAVLSSDVLPPFIYQYDGDIIAITYYYNQKLKIKNTILKSKDLINWKVIKSNQNYQGYIQAIQKIDESYYLYTTDYNDYPVNGEILDDKINIIKMNDIEDFNKAESFNTILLQHIYNIKNILFFVYNKQYFLIIQQDNSFYIFQSFDGENFHFEYSSINNNSYNLNDILEINDKQYLLFLNIDKSLYITNGLFWIEQLLQKMTISKKINKSEPTPDIDQSTALNPIFMRMAKEKDILVYIRSGAPYNATGGAQRPQQIADELSRRGYPVIHFSYHNPKGPTKSGTFVEWEEEMIPYIKAVSNVQTKIFLPTFPDWVSLDAMRELDDSWFVYYDCVDDWAGFASVFTGMGVLGEEEICQRANLITATGRTMMGKLLQQSNNAKIRWLPNSTCIDLNNMKLSNYSDFDLVFVGHFDYWLDMELIKLLLNKYSILFIGECEGDYKINHYNAHYTGSVLVEDIAPLLSKAKIGIVPFKDIKLVTAVDPIKYYDYLAAGLPTVATYMPELMERPYCHVSDTYEDFINNINLILLQEIDRKEIIKVAHKHTIQVRVDSLLKVLPGHTRPQIIHQPDAPKQGLPVVKPTNKTYRVSNRPYLKDTDYKLRLTVEAPASCNMQPQCPYCSNAESRGVCGKAFFGDPKQWLDSLSWLSEEYGPLYLTSCYGEPLSSLESINIYAEMAKGNLVDIVSNIIAPIEHIQLFPINGNVRFATSFHPHYWSVEQFIEKRLAIQDAGYHCGVSLIVAYPPYISKLEKWKKQIEDIGSSVEILTFYGLFQGEYYPQAYNEKDKEIVLGYQNDFNNRDDNELVQKTAGMKCWAGSKYIFINWRGDVMQCPAYGVRKLGNLLERNFELFTEPQTCLAEFCGCADLWHYVVKE